MTEYQIVALATCQFSWGGLFDSRPADPCIHLVRMADRGGTPGPTLCDIDRFDRTGPGFSIGGGVGDPDALACPDCVDVADRLYPELPVWTGTWAHIFSRPPSPWDNRGLPSVPWDSGTEPRGIQPYVNVHHKEAPRG